MPVVSDDEAAVSQVDPFIPLRQFGRMAGIKSPTTLSKREREDGDFPKVITIGRRRYVRESEVAKYLDELEERSRRAAAVCSASAAEAAQRMLAGKADKRAAHLRASAR